MRSNARTSRSPREGTDDLLRIKGAVLFAFEVRAFVGHRRRLISGHRRANHANNLELALNSASKDPVYLYAVQPARLGGPWCIIGSVVRVRRHRNPILSFQ